VDEKVFSQSKAMAGFVPADNIAQDLETTRVEVRIAIEEHVRGGSDEAYDAIKGVFEPIRKRSARDDREAVSSERIKTYLLALTSCVSLLGKTAGKDCSGLVKAILEAEWMGRDEGFVKIYVHFLGSLASAQGASVGAILGMLVGKFTGRE
jgi:RNA polymerase I-specific transcription initiation factor RRN3